MRSSSVHLESMLLLYIIQDILNRVTQILALHIDVLPNPPYASVHAPSDRQRFLSVQCKCGEKKFINFEEIKPDMEYFFASKSEGFYAICQIGEINVIDNGVKYYHD